MYYIDSWAWIEYLRGSKAGAKVRELIESTEPLITSRLALFEVYCRLLKDVPEAVAREQVRKITDKLKTTVQEIDEELMFSAAKIKREEHLAMGDAFGMATARKHNAKVITGDGDFKPFAETIFIE